MPQALQLTLSVTSLALAWLGLGTPNHVFQVYLTLWIGAFAYLRLPERRPHHPIEWVTAAVQLLTLCVMMKLLIGAGLRSPFFWVKFPMLEWGKWQVLWQESGISEWKMDVTGVQSVLVLCTLLGSFMRLQGLASFAAAILLLFSIPSFLEFNWAYVLPALLCYSLSLLSSKRQSLVSSSPS